MPRMNHSPPGAKTQRTKYKYCDIGGASPGIDQHDSASPGIGNTGALQTSTTT